MSAGYGYYRIAVVKKDGGADADKAKAVFDFLHANYDWCREEEPFVLDGHEISNNDKKWADGVDIKRTDIPASDFDWLVEAQKATGAERIVASIVQDFSESSYESNTCLWAVIEDGKRSHYDSFNFNSFVYGKCDSGGCYCGVFDDSNYEEFTAKLRNKKTGEEAVCGGLFINPDGDYDYVEEAVSADEYYILFVNHETGSEAVLLDKDGDRAHNVGEFDHFSDDFDIVKDCFEENAEDWEFVGFTTQPDIFERYAKNPPAQKYADYADFIDD